VDRERGVAGFGVLELRDAFGGVEELPVETAYAVWVGIGGVGSGNQKGEALTGCNPARFCHGPREIICRRP
jgi:hypothetical protein